jgi:hypothetical protein
VAARIAGTACLIWLSGACPLMRPLFLPKLQVTWPSTTCAMPAWNSGTHTHASCNIDNHNKDTTRTPPPPPRKRLDAGVATLCTHASLNTEQW